MRRFRAGWSGVTTRFADSMFSRTALLVAASGFVFAMLFLVVGRTVAGLPAIRASAATLAEVIERYPRAVAQSAEGPPPARLRDEALARTLVWRAFAGELQEKLGSGAMLAIRADERGATVWVRVPASGTWARWHTELPDNSLRAGMLAMLVAVAAAVLVGGVLLARQITGPLRRLAVIADRLAAGEPLSLEPRPGETFAGGPLHDPPFPAPKEVRRVYQAFQRLCSSLRAAEQEREAMLAGVSHDVRTPVSRMRFALELYGESAGRRLLDEVEHELQELEQVASRFVAYARSNYEEPFGLVVLDDLVASAIRSRSFEGSVSFEPGAPRPACLQSGNVRALIDNLLENARKHGAEPVHVKTLQSAGEVQLVVRDGGSGIPATEQRVSLQPFVRLADQDAPGSGLGLAIVARVAKRHNGRVEMQNRADGFEVRVTLSPPRR